MKQDHGQTDANQAAVIEAPRTAPGKRTMTANLPPVQRAAVGAAADAVSIGGPAETSAYVPEDPFAVHLLDTPVQRHGDGDGRGDVHAAAARGLEAPAERLPFLDQIQRSFGDQDVSGVQAHVGGAAAEASASMGASAYATGGHVAFAGRPDLHTAAHEAAHVVQQARGVNLYGGVGEAGDSYERNADAVADRVVAGQSASDLLAGNSAGAAVAGAVQRKEKKHGRGFSEYGGGRVREVLTTLVEAGLIAITGKQIALLDAVAQVETGGKIACVQTSDDQVVSVGFKQVVLGHGSLEKIMKKAPGGFAKHGLTLDMSKTYTHAGWSNKPHQIAGCEDEEELRTREWGMKFYHASMEPDVIAAMCELALGEFGKVESAVKKHAGGIDHFSDPTAQGWLLETYNNRPAFMSLAIKRAVDSGARSAASRDAFLDVLGAAIVETYVIEEPILHYKKAVKRRGKVTDDERATLLADSKATYEAVGRRKGTNIITKISRHLVVPKIDGAKAPAEPAQDSAPAEAAPAQQQAPADDVLMSLPAPEPENMSLPGEEPQMSVPETAPAQSIAPAPEPEPSMSIAAPAQAAIEPAAPTAAPSIEVSPPPAPVAVEPAAPAPAKEEPRWSVRARAYNRENAEYSDQFRTATGSACLGADGEIDPAMVARWQVAHGVSPDGRVGPLTVNAAIGGEPVSPDLAVAPVAPPTANLAEPSIAVPNIAAPSIAVPTLAAPTLAAPTLAAPTLTAGPTTVPVVPEIEPAQQADLAPVEAPKPKADAPAPLVKGMPSRLVVDGGAAKIGFQKCLVFLSPGLSTATPDLFLFFHGYFADYGKDVDKKQKRPEKMHLSESGSDVAEKAMAAAAGKNVIAILPQGNIGARDEHGGHMKGLDAGLPTFITSVLANVAQELGVKELAPGHISMAGHSAGGYEGIHSALDVKRLGSLADNVTDVTLMDASYGGSQFSDARDWLFTGSAGKSLRIIGQKEQVITRGEMHGEYLGPKALDRYAAKHGFTVQQLDIGEKRDTSTVIQHSHILKDGQFHADVLILLSKRHGSGKGHHDIRDDVMDDAILSIGEGAEGAEHFDRDAVAAAVAAPGVVAAHLDDGDDAAPAVAPTAPEVGPSPDDRAPDSDQAVPVGQHVDGAVGPAPEPIKAPEVKPAPPPKAKPKSKSKSKKGDELRDQLYNEETGVIRKDKLHRDNVGKDRAGNPVPIHLDDAQWDFKQRVYLACVATLGDDKLYGGVPDDEMTKFSAHDGGKMRHAAVGPLQQMLDELEADPGKPAGAGIRVGSTYRGPEVDFGLWDMAFNNIYLWDAIKWAKAHSPDDPWGAKVVKDTVEKIGHRKAPPGGSNHSNGTAVDLQVKLGGKWKSNKFGDQDEWYASWQFEWLKKNCGRHGFKRYSGEAWHYDYKG